MEEASENADGEEEHTRDTVQDTVPDEGMKYWTDKEVSRSSLPCPRLTFARGDTSDAPRGHEDGCGDEARYDEGQGDAVGGVGHEDSDAEDGHHVEDRPDSDGESGHGDQGHPDREDSGEHIRPAEEADRGQTHGVHLLRACVVETNCFLRFLGFWTQNQQLQKNTLTFIFFLIDFSEHPLGSTAIVLIPHFLVICTNVALLPHWDEVVYGWPL